MRLDDQLAALTRARALAAETPIARTPSSGRIGCHLRPAGRSTVSISGMETTAGGSATGLARLVVRVGLVVQAAERLLELAHALAYGAGGVRQLRGAEH